MESKITPNPMTPDKTPEEILKENWYKVTQIEYDDVVKNHLGYALKAMQEYADQEKRKAQIYLLEYCIKEFKKRKGYLPPHSYLELIKENIENGSTMHQQFNNKN